MSKTTRAFLMILTVFGIGTVIVTLWGGHQYMNTTQHVPWGLWVALYVYFLGLSAGAFLIACIIYAFNLKQYESIGPLAFLTALGGLIIGGFLIVMDLGHPFRAYKVLTSFNSSSIMSWMAVFYLFYIVVIAIGLKFSGPWAKKIGDDSFRRGRLRLVAFFGIPVALLILFGEGTLFAVAKARPNWYSGLLPVIFLLSALASGGGFLAFLLVQFSKKIPGLKIEWVRQLIYLSLGILLFDLLLTSSEILVTFYGYVPRETAAWQLTLFGPYWWVFWLGQLGLGAAVPIYLIKNQRNRDDLPRLATAGILIAVGILAARLNFVIPPQVIPTFENLPEAYLHARNAIGYFPSLVEWGVSFFAFALGGWMLFAAKKLFPVEQLGGQKQ